MNVPFEARQAITRRHFFREGAVGIGTAALASMLAGDRALGGQPVRSDAPVVDLPPRAKNVIYIFQAGGPAQMVPGQHHVRMNMYIAQSRGGRFQVVEPLGVIEPHEHLQAVG